MRPISVQQRAVLSALHEESPLPTTVLRDVRAPYDLGGRERTYRIGEPVGAVLRRLERRGLVFSERGRDCNEWWISEDGISLIDGDEEGPNCSVCGFGWGEGSHGNCNA